MNLLVYSISGSLDRFRCYALFRIKLASLLRDLLSRNVSQAQLKCILLHPIRDGLSNKPFLNLYYFIQNKKKIQ